MQTFLSYLLIIAALTMSVAGCHSVQPGDLPVLPDSVLGPAGTAAVKLDRQLIPGYNEVKNELDAFQLSAATRPLTAAEAACLAASQCRLAKVLEKEAARTRHEIVSRHRGAPSSLLPAILCDRAAHERNQAAQQSLVAYYQLAGVHLQAGVIVESYDELARVERAMRGLAQAGVPVDVDMSDLERRRAELDRRNADLNVSEVRLTAQVKTLIGEDPLSMEAIETNCSLEPRPAGYDLYGAMEIARANDFQLKSIQRLVSDGDAEDLDVVRSTLQTVSPLLGQAPVSLGFFAKLRMVMSHQDPDEDELRTRKQQLRQLYEIRRQQVDLEVADRMVTVQQRLLEVGIAKDVLASWKGRLEQLESQRELQKSEYRDLIDAKVSRLQAESDLLSKVVALEVAHAELRGTMGLLEQECLAVR